MVEGRVTGDGMSDKYDYVVHIGYPRDGSKALHIAIRTGVILQRGEGHPGVFGFMAARFVEHCMNAMEELIITRDGEALSRAQILTLIKEELDKELPR